MNWSTLNDRRSKMKYLPATGRQSLEEQKRLAYNPLGGAKLGERTLLPMRQVVRGTDTTKSQDSYFPTRLHYMLKEVEKDGMSYIISWQPHGRCFRVHNKRLFVEKILPYWFCQTKFTSFQRQLNLYSFQRISKGVDKGAYFHPLFLRGHRDLCAQIPRIKIKGMGPRKASCPENEPNFQNLPFLPHVDEDKEEESLAKTNVNHQELVNSKFNYKVSESAGKTSESAGKTNRELFLSSMAQNGSAIFPLKDIPSDALLMEARRVTQASINLMHAIEVNDALSRQTSENLAAVSTRSAPLTRLHNDPFMAPLTTFAGGHDGGLFTTTTHVSTRTSGGSLLFTEPHQFRGQEQISITDLQRKHPPAYMLPAEQEELMKCILDRSNILPLASRNSITQDAILDRQFGLLPPPRWSI